MYLYMYILIIPIFSIFALSKNKYYFINFKIFCKKSACFVKLFILLHCLKYKKLCRILAIMLIFLTIMFLIISIFLLSKWLKSLSDF
jgi:hypothetical protein